VTPQFKVFHFQELDWLLYFPVEGNRGKYYGYTVLFEERKGKAKRCQTPVVLGNVIERAEFDEHYPHTVGFFKSSCEETADGELRYMEIRTIHNIDEFWLFMNALNL
jgi:hypothetical protein